jgi:hypothetical protein
VLFLGFLPAALESPPRARESVPKQPDLLARRVGVLERGPAPLERLPRLRRRHRHAFGQGLGVLGQRFEPET